MPSVARVQRIVKSVSATRRFTGPMSTNFRRRVWMDSAERAIVKGSLGVVLVVGGRADG